MCGGATALKSHGVRPTDRVGILGVGGLGYLTIQFAAKMACEVIFFSGTDGKKDEATKLGAMDLYAMKGVTKPEDHQNIRLVNHFLITTSARPDYGLYTSILALGATTSLLFVTEKVTLSFYTCQ